MLKVDSRSVQGYEIFGAAKIACHIFRYYVLLKVDVVIIRPAQPCAILDGSNKFRPLSIREHLEINKKLTR